MITFCGFLFGCVGAGFLAFHMLWPALACLGLNRLCDGVDGSVARHAGTDDTGFGGFLDIVLDMLIYGLWPFAFALGVDTHSTWMAACFLLVCYLGTGCSFLALSSILASKGRAADDRKSLIFGHGLAEGTETFAFMAIICLLPGWFVPICYAYGTLCLLTIGQRILQANKLLR